MPKFNVIFKFDNDNIRSASVLADSKEELVGKIKNDSDWFEYTEGKIDYFIQLDNVTSFSIRKVK